jgi:hypothetical protein
MSKYKNTNMNVHVYEETCCRTDHIGGYRICTYTIKLRYKKLLNNAILAVINSSTGKQITVKLPIKVITELQLNIQSVLKVALPRVHSSSETLLYFI